jgi:hypothetical protein
MLIGFWVVHAILTQNMHPEWKGKKRWKNKKRENNEVKQGKKRFFYSENLQKIETRGCFFK